jgi:microcompartment protein CcmL/EutN
MGSARSVTVTTSTSLCGGWFVVQSIAGWLAVVAAALSSCSAAVADNLVSIIIFIHAAPRMARPMTTSAS